MSAFTAPVRVANEVRRGGKRVIYFSLHSLAEIKRFVVFNGRTHVGTSSSMEWTEDENRYLIHLETEC